MVSTTTAAEGTPKEAWTKAGGSVTVSFVPDGSVQVLGNSRSARLPPPRAATVSFFLNSHWYPKLTLHSHLRPHSHPLP
jgi:hypothetical protein